MQSRHPRLRSTRCPSRERTMPPPKPLSCKRPMTSATHPTWHHLIQRTFMDITNRIRHYFNQNGQTKPQPGSVPQTILEQKQQLLAHHVRLVARKITYGLFVAGPGGLGKSRTISNTLAAEGIEPVLLNSHVTPLMLYRLLFEHRKGRILWLDDCDSIYANLQVLGLLRSALWGQGERLVTYPSSQLEDIPSQFVFDSRIVFCANTIPKRNEAFKAVLSRVDVFHLSATNEEIVEQMRLLAAKGYHSLTHEQCGEVVDFINGSGGTRQLSMRLYEPSLKKVEYALRTGVAWQELVRCQLDQLGKHELPSGDTRALDFAAIEAAVEQYPASVALQEQYWTEARNKSRATFFRVKKAWDEQAGNKGAGD